MRVIEVEGLGYEAAIVTIKREPILMIDAGLGHDERVGVMLGAMKDLDE